MPSMTPDADDQSTRQIASLSKRVEQLETALYQTLGLLKDLDRALGSDSMQAWESKIERARGLLGSGAIRPR